MVHLRVCYELKTNNSDPLLYLFPSLALEVSMILVSLQTILLLMLLLAPDNFKFSIPPTNKLLVGIRFIPQGDRIFVPGFFCLLVVEIFRKFNVS